MTETEVCRWYDLILNSMLLSRSKRANVGYEFTGQCVPAPLKPETARRMSVEQFERCCEYAIATSNHVSWLQTNALSFANHVHHVHILRMSYLIIHVYNIYIYIYIFYMVHCIFHIFQAAISWVHVSGHVALSLVHVA